MGNDSVATRYGTCRTCGHDIVNRGRGWYHSSAVTRERADHFAEPMPVSR